MTLLMFYTALFSIATAASVVLTGNRQLLSGNLVSISGVWALVFNWRFILAMALSVLSRYLFVVINSRAYAIPHLSSAATTITALIGAISYPVILVANVLFLSERVSVRQLIGATLVMGGIILASTRQS